jgi:hypothetical protein
MSSEVQAGGVEEEAMQRRYDTIPYHTIPYDTISGS